VSTPGLRASLLVALAACASAMQPRPASVDPSNPDAPEAQLALTTALNPRDFAGPLPAAEPPGEAGHRHAAPAAEPSHPHGGARDGGAPQAGVFTCPMHPDVVQPLPGNCGRCGMKLVPKQQPAAPAQVFTCPMHPEVQQGEPGKCPKCGMKLVPKKEASK
jgi:hypothetical protein